MELHALFPFGVYKSFIGHSVEPMAIRCYKDFSLVVTWKSGNYTLDFVTIVQIWILSRMIFYRHWWWGGGAGFVTTDLDPPKLGPPGPNFLKNMDP